MFPILDSMGSELALFGNMPHVPQCELYSNLVGSLMFLGHVSMTQEWGEDENRALPTPCFAFVPYGKARKLYRK